MLYAALSCFGTILNNIALKLVKAGLTLITSFGTILNNIALKLQMSSIQRVTQRNQGL